MDEAHCIKKWYAIGGIACVMVIIFCCSCTSGGKFQEGIL